MTIEIHFQGLRFIKKYLVIRHPRAPKTFAIQMPKEELKELIAKKPPSEEALPATEEEVLPIKPAQLAVRRPAKVKIYQAKAIPISEEVISQLIDNARRFEALAKRKPTPSKNAWQRFISWISGGIFGKQAEKPVITISQKAIERSIVSMATIIIEKNTQKIIDEKVDEQVHKLLPSAEAVRQLLKNQAQQILVSETRDFVSKEAATIIQNIAPKILEKEVDKILARDVPRGQGLVIIEREISKIVVREAPAILDRETKKAASLNFPTAEVVRIAGGMIRAKVEMALSKETIWQLARSEVKNKVINDLERDLPPLLKEEIAKRLDQKEKVKPIKTPRLAEGNAFDYRFELEPGKILLIKMEAGRYQGYIYSAEDRSISALQELSYQGLKDLLEKGGTTTP